MNTVVLKVMDWELLSPFGDKNALLAALAAPGQTQKMGATAATAPATHVLNVPNFEVREALGKKGTRAFDRHTGLFVKAASNAIVGSGIAPEALRAAAVINGTAAGSLSSILDFLLDTYRNERPYFVNPAHMPNTVLNCAASQCAIWHAIKGPNATVSSGSQSFMAALRMASQWARLDYAQHFLVGAVEEITPVSSDLLASFRQQTGYQGCFAEGGAAFMCQAQAHDASHSADDLILATQIGTDMALASGLERISKMALHQAGVLPQALSHIVTKSPAWSASARAEAILVQKLGVISSNAYEWFGHGYSVSGAMQLALLFHTLAPGAFGMAISASRNGSVGVTLVKKGSPL